MLPPSMPASRDHFLADIARALRSSLGDAEGDALVRPLEPWLDIGWPFPPGRGREAPSPRAAVSAAELAVVEAFPDRAHELLVPLARISSAAALAEAVTWESVTTTPTEAQPFRRVSGEPERYENVEKAFQCAGEEERRALLESITEERAASLIRRRVRLRAGTLDRGRLLLTRLTAFGSADLPASASWVEIVTLGQRSGGSPAGFLVSWLPASHHAAADEAIAQGAAHVWCDDAAARWDVDWRPGWVRS